MLCRRTATVNRRQPCGLSIPYLAAASDTQSAYFPLIDRLLIPAMSASVTAGGRALPDSDIALPVQQSAVSQSQKEPIVVGQRLEVVASSRHAARPNK